MAIPAATTMTQVDTLPGEEIEFSIGDPRWVMRSQADLYSNRELAVVREYSTNAFDANKEKAMEEGTDIEPIEVTLPSMMNPYFKVRDYGYGMTRDILAEVYTKFGTSTKRTSNHFNGMLGYGSKSAVAYSTQFTVTSVSEGIKTIAVVTRKPDWSIVMKIISQVKSDERSGVEVMVPVHNHEEFRQKAMDFYKFWLPGTVLIDGKEPEHAVGEKIAEGFYASPEWNTSYVVMGNVPYRIENPRALFWNTGMNQINFVAYVENGNVEFTPSREDLKYTDLTKNSLRDVITNFSDEIKAKAQAEIDDAETHGEAYAAWKKWSDMLGKGLFGDLSFKGDKFKSDFKVDAYKYRYNYRGGSRNINDWHVESADKTLFILGQPAGNPSSAKKAKVVEYADHVGLSVSYYLFVRASEVDCPWIDQTGGNFVTWDEIVKALPAKPKATGTGGRTKAIKGSFDIWEKSGWKREAEIPEDYDPAEYFYMTPGERKSNDYSLSTIFHYLPGSDKIKVVMVGANRLGKFGRDYPDIEKFIPFAKSKVIVKGESLLTQDDKDIMSIDYYDKRWLDVLDHTRLDDPELVRYAKLNKSPAKRDEYDRNLSLAQALKEWHLVKQWKAPAREREIFKKYPLIARLNSYGIHKDIYIYLNAAYAARKDKK